MPRTVPLKRSGYFAIGPGGIPREGHEGPYMYTLPKNPRHLTPDSIVKSMFSGEDRPFKRHLVEQLASVRDSGRMYHGEGAYDWLASRGYVYPIEAVFDDYCIVIKFKLTEKGERFLKEYEAPVEW